MTHRDIIPLLSDLLSNQVPEPDATEAWSHVATCAECRQAVTAMHEVRAAVVRGGAQLFDAHPTSREIVQVALDDPSLSAGNRSKIESHLADCGACSEEVDLTRKADAATRRSGSGPISIPGVSVAWLVPALAAAVAVLAFPAYIGVARHPQLQRAHQEASQRFDELRTEQEQLIRELSAREQGGPVRLLYLGPTTRGIDPVPVASLLPEQTWQPLIVQHRPFAGSSPTGRVTFEVIREADQASVWTQTVEMAEAWDARFEAVTLLVPARKLETGGHRIVIGGPGVVGYEGHFEVRRGRP